MANSHADVDGHGYVSFAEQAIFMNLFDKAPDPSGVIP
jgi:hypothetical protein